MKTQEGRDAWKEHGKAIDVVFNLNNKESLAVLTAARRAKRPNAVALSWEEDKHPRNPSGEGGGQFTSGGGGTATKEPPPEFKLTQKWFETRIHEKNPHLDPSSVESAAAEILRDSTGMPTNTIIMGRIEKSFFDKTFPEFNLEKPKNLTYKTTVNESEITFNNYKEWQAKDPKILEKISPEKIAGLVGLQKDAKVKYRVLNDNYNKITDQNEYHVTVEIDHKIYEAHRSLKFVVDGTPTEIHNDFFAVKSEFQGMGIGTKILYDQVQGAKIYGIKKIETEAVRQDSEEPDVAMNGYYTWPKLGYDADLTEANLTNKQQVFAAGMKWKKLSDVMKTKEGRDWWKKEGDSLTVVFDITNKNSLAVLTAARRAKDPKALALSMFGV
jgi:GNAT superfamily N-acetyltransferase